MAEEEEGGSGVIWWIALAGVGLWAWSQYEKRQAPAKAKAAVSEPAWMQGLRIERAYAKSEGKRDPVQSAAVRRKLKKRG